MLSRDPLSRACLCRHEMISDSRANDSVSGLRYASAPSRRSHRPHARLRSLVHAAFLVYVRLLRFGHHLRIELWMREKQSGHHVCGAGLCCGIRRRRRVLRLGVGVRLCRGPVGYCVSCGVCSDILFLQELERFRGMLGGALYSTVLR